jgi:hypothetical protein
MVLIRTYGTNSPQRIPVKTLQEAKDKAQEILEAFIKGAVIGGEGDE